MYSTLGISALMVAAEDGGARARAPYKTGLREGIGCALR
jgi:hypothetical protein